MQDLYEIIYRYRPIASYLKKQSLDAAFPHGQKRIMYSGNEEGPYSTPGTAD